MLDINIEAQNALEKTGYPVVFHYPQRMDSLPVISFCTVSETGEMSADNRDMFTSGVVRLDVFSSVPAECGEMDRAICKAMTDDGWSRLSAVDVPERADGLFHRSMEYTKSFFTWEE